MIIKSSKISSVLYQTSSAVLHTVQTVPYVLFSVIFCGQALYQTLAFDLFRDFFICWYSTKGIPVKDTRVPLDQNFAFEIYFDEYRYVLVGRHDIGIKHFFTPSLLFLLGTVPYAFEAFVFVEQPILNAYPPIHFLTWNWTALPLADFQFQWRPSNSVSCSLADSIICTYNTTVIGIPYFLFVGCLALSRFFQRWRD
jgi:hypothetical protein